MSPTRFIASAGKLDSEKRYLQQMPGGRLQWPGPTAQALYMTARDSYGAPGFGFQNTALTPGAHNASWSDPGKLSLDV